MKFNKIGFLSVLLAGGLFTGCTDLEYQAVDSIVEESSEDGGTLGEPDALIAAGYAALGSVFHGQENTYALTEHTSDEMLGPTRGTDWSDNGIWRSLHTHNWSPEHQFILNSWNALNGNVYQTTEALAASTTNEQKAHARFLRAYNMFHVVDFWGKQPFRELTEGADVNPKVMSRSEATQYIIDDLTFAMENLPDCGGLGTANKNTARALLAKVYLNKGVFMAANPAGPYDFAEADMDMVISLADAIENSGCGYGLATNYFDNFVAANAETSSELIFTIPNEPGNGVNGSCSNRYYMTLHYNQNPSGWNGFTTLANFYSKFEDGDQRKGGEITGVTDVSGIRAGFLVGQQYDQDGNMLQDRKGNPLAFTSDVKLAGNGEVEGIRVIKYPPDYSNVGGPGNDYVLLRYADVLLMKAEAHLRKGDAAGALGVVNDLRSTRGASSLGSLSEQDLLDERGRELYWEGWRRNDLIRFGQFTSAWELKLAGAGHEVLFPIPQIALDSNPNLTQNDGY